MLAQSCLTLCNLMDYSTLGSFVHGIFQTRKNTGAGFHFLLQGSPTWQARCLPLSHLESPAAAAKSLQSCPTLCDPMDGSPQGSPVPGILQARTWSGLPLPSPVHESESEVAQSCLTPSDPMDCSPPGSSIHGIFQARVLEWDAIAFFGNYLLPCIPVGAPCTKE